MATDAEITLFDNKNYPKTQFKVGIKLGCWDNYPLQRNIVIIQNFSSIKFIPKSSNF